MRVKLRDQTGMFLDPETDLRVVRGEIVDLVGRPGALTREFLKHGGLIQVPDEAIPSPLGNKAAEADLPPAVAPDPSPSPSDKKSPVAHKKPAATGKGK